ncbi:MAG: DegV family protein [Anaerolineaceae bacterium]|nr:DegV family protein [Anaerolineaceae bacterium]
MANIKVITDSDSSLSLALAEQYGIRLVPITIQFGSESFTTNIDIDDKLLFEKIDASGKLPTTAAPSPGAFTIAFTEAFAAGADSIICICVSGKVSSTYESALLAAREMPERKITIIDSCSMTIGQGMVALAAAEAVAAGSSHEEAVKKAESLIPRLYTYASFSTLKYLAMSGRVGKFVAVMASALDIRPLLTLRDGVLQMLEKVRTRSAAMDRLVNLIVKASEGKTIERIGFYHINNPDDLKVLEARLREKLDLPADALRVEFTPGLSVHAGPGMIGAFLLSK